MLFTMKNDERNTPSKSNNEGNIESKQVFMNGRNADIIGTNPVKTNPCTLIVKCSDCFKKEFLDYSADTGKSCVADQSKSDPQIMDKTRAAEHGYYSLIEHCPKSHSDDTDRMDLELKVSFSLIIYEDENKTDFNEFVDILRQFSKNIQTGNSKCTLSTDENISKRFVPKSSRSSDARPEMNSVSTQTSLSCRKSTEKQKSGKSVNSTKTFHFESKISRRINGRRCKSSPSNPQTSIFSLDNFIYLTNLIIDNMIDLLHFIKGGTADPSPDDESWGTSRRKILNKRLALIPPEFGTGIESQIAKSSLETIEIWNEEIRNGPIKGMCYFMKTHAEQERQEQSCQQNADSSDIFLINDNALETSAGSEHGSFADPQITKLPNVKLSKVTSSTVTPVKLPSASVTPSKLSSASVVPSNSASVIVAPSNSPSVIVAPSNSPSVIVSPSNSPSVIVAPSNLSSVVVAPSNLLSARVKPDDLPLASVTPDDLPLASVTPDDLPLASMTSNKMPSPESASIEVPETREFSNNYSKSHQELLLLNELEGVSPSLDTLHSDLNLFILKAETLLQKIVDVAESVILDFLGMHDQVMLEEISCHIWDLMLLIEYLSNLRKDCSTLLKINNGNSDMYVLKVKFYIAHYFGLLLRDTNQMIFHLEDFVMEYSICN